VNLEEVVLTDADRRFDDLVALLKTEAAAKSARSSPDHIETVDERDLRTQIEANERVLDGWVSGNMKLEQEGKVRCGFKWCNKLFKGVDFLSKHLKQKHAPDATLRELVNIALPFMRKHYLAEDMTSRPLPPIELETSSGIELISVRNVLERTQETMQRPQQGADGRPSFNNERSSFVRRGNDAPRRYSGGGNRRESFPTSGPARTEDPVRPLVTYLDMDAPKVSFVHIVCITSRSCLSQSMGLPRETLVLYTCYKHDT
jgi:hypothetical protein